jgi:hypothetical protein
MMNPLTKYPRAREIAYLVWWIASGVTGVTMAVYLAIQPDSVPTPVMVATLVVSLGGTYLGFTAQSNVTGTDAQGLPVATSDERGR